MTYLGYGYFDHRYEDYMYYGVMSGSLFVRNYFKLSNKEAVTKITNYTTLAIRDMINNATWMTNKTRTYAIDKLDEMLQTIGYSDVLVNETRLNGFLKLRFGSKVVVIIIV